LTRGSASFSSSILEFATACWRSSSSTTLVRIVLLSLPWFRITWSNSSPSYCHFFCLPIVC
jgi:hypothetical protein